MINTNISFKIAKPITGQTYVRRLDILANYKAVPYDYDFVGNNDEDVTTFRNLNIFYGANRFNFKVFRRSLIDSILPNWTGFTNSEKRKLVNQNVYPESTTDNELINILGSQQELDILRAKYSAFELSDDREKIFTGYTATTDNKINYISGNTITINEFSNYTGNTSINFTGYTAATNVRLNNIETDVTYLSGQTDTKLNISNFNSYSATTDSRIDGNDSDITYLSGQTDTKLNISNFNIYSGNTQNEINSKIPKISGATANNIALTKIDGTIYDSGISIDNITGGTGFYFYADKETSQSTTSNSNVVYLTGTGTGLQAGTWSVDFNAVGGNDSKNKTIFVSFYIDNTLQGSEQTVESTSGNDRISFSISKDLTLTAGSHTFEIRFRVGNGTGVIDYGSIRAKLLR